MDEFDVGEIRSGGLVAGGLGLVALALQVVFAIVPGVISPLGLLLTAISIVGGGWAFVISFALMARARVNERSADPARFAFGTALDKALSDGLGLDAAVGQVLDGNDATPRVHERTRLTSDLRHTCPTCGRQPRRFASDAVMAAAPWNFCLICKTQWRITQDLQGPAASTELPLATRALAYLGRRGRWALAAPLVFLLGWFAGLTGGMATGLAVATIGTTAFLFIPGRRAV